MWYVEFVFAHSSIQVSICSTPGEGQYISYRPLLFINFWPYSISPHMMATQRLTSSHVSTRSSRVLLMAAHIWGHTVKYRNRIEEYLVNINGYIHIDNTWLIHILIIENLPHYRGNITFTDTFINSHIQALLSNCLHLLYNLFLPCIHKLTNVPSSFFPLCACAYTVCGWLLALAS